MTTGSDTVVSTTHKHASCGILNFQGDYLDGRIWFIQGAPLACAFVKNGKKLFSVRVRAIALYSERDEGTHADV